MARRIDAHQHFWRYQPDEYGWIDDSMPQLQQDFLPELLAATLAERNIDATVLVQARQSWRETEWLLELSQHSPTVGAVVGWIDLRADDVAARLDQSGDAPALRGFRHQIQDESDAAGWMARADVTRGMRLLQQRERVFDLLVTHRQLKETVTFAARHDAHHLVLDHFGKPDLAAGVDHWRRQVAPLAAMPHVSCKLSGLLTEPRPAAMSVQDLLPFYHAALELFGSDRLLFGSDWPVCLLHGDYDQGWQLCQTALAGLSDDEQAAILGGNAGRIYHCYGNES